MGEYLLVEPVVQRKVVRIASQERHRSVGVRVLESRDYQLSGKVYLPVEITGRDILRADKRYPAAIRVKFTGDDVLTAHRKYSRIVKAYFHVSSVQPNSLFRDSV